MMLFWLVDFFHNFPRWNFSFAAVGNDFEPQQDTLYVQGLGVWSVLTLAISLLLLLVVIIVWSIRCCRTRQTPAKRTTKVRRLSLALFIISLFCFVWLGASLFGSERVNRGVQMSLTSFDDIIRNTMSATDKLASLEKTVELNVTGILETLAKLIAAHSAQVKNITALSMVHGLIENLGVSVDAVNGSVSKMNSTVYPFLEIDSARSVIFRIEKERWLLFALLLSVSIVVLFGGVVGFCRHSKKAAVLFSGLCIVIYLVCWLLLSLVVAMSLGLSDFCIDPEPYIKNKFEKNSTKNVAHYYLSCNSTEGADLPAPTLLADTSLIDITLQNMQRNATELSEMLDSLFANPQMKSASSNLSLSLSGVVKQLGALENIYACTTFHSDSDDIQSGLCDTGITGFGVLLLSLLLLGFFLFVLLITVSKAWHLYSHRPLDYVEVDEEDPFVPRGDRSNIPVDIYGTHVFNPRTRFASAGDSDGNETAGSTPLWQRGAPPPAYDSVGITGQGHSRRNR